MTLAAADSLTSTTTANEAVTRALKRLGKYDANASPAAVDLQDGLAALNEMISSWAADGLATADQALDATVTSGSAEITDLESTSDLAVGMFVTGSGISSETQIKSIDSPTQVTLTAEATSTGTYTLNFTALPFDASLEGGVVAMLAVRLAEDYGITPGPVLLRDADRGEARLAAAFLHVPKASFDAALTRTPSQIIRGSD